MAVEPVLEARQAVGVRLAEPDDGYAERVASWVRGAREAYWLAPRTAPPLTAEKVRAWVEPGCKPFLLVAEGEGQALAYGELNVLSTRRREYWLGHLIVDPSRRGAGLGRQLTQTLLRRAFDLHGARRVSLVVFAENRAAVKCYRAAGMRADGYESHFFAARNRWERLLRFVATRATPPSRQSERT